MSHVEDRAAVPVFVCPACLGQLQQIDVPVADGQRENGSGFRCAGCSRNYPVRNGILRFVPDPGYSESFGFQWNKFRRTQLDSFTGLPLSRNRVFLVTDWPARLGGETILEAGSGAGRFTEILASTGATVYTFDLSSAVEANLENNGSKGNVTIFQGSIYEIPFRPGTFDKVICLGVLQHTPDPDRAFSSLARMVKPGGQLAVDVYARTLKAVVGWKYILRPITTRMDRYALFRIINTFVPRLVPISAFMRRIAGAAGARAIPILQYAHWGLPDELNRQWAVLDTFDMYSPAHDHPKTIHEVKAWFAKAGFENVFVGHGPNGVVARGRRPKL